MCVSHSYNSHCYGQYELVHNNGKNRKTFLEKKWMGKVYQHGIQLRGWSRVNSAVFSAAAHHQ